MNAALVFSAACQLAIAAAPVAAQPGEIPAAENGSTGDNAAARAKDAFGERIGQEQVGLYNESQVRGFDLATTASYRLEGRYFLREFSLPDIILDGVSVKVGVSAARQNYPSPSGVVDYRLRKAPAGARTFSVNTGIKESMSLFAEATGAYATDDGRFGVAGGATVTPRSRYPNQTEGYLVNAGAVPQWQPNDSLRIRAILSGEFSTYDGDYVYARAGQFMPPKPPREKFAVPWADVRRRSINTGILVDAEPAPDWTLTATAYYADTRRKPVDFTTAALTADDTAIITWIRSDVVRGRSLTGELTAERRFASGNSEHALIAAARGRQSRQLNVSRPPVFVGIVDVNNLIFPPQPPLPPSPGELNSDIDQGIFSLGYRGDFFDRLEVKFGVHRSIYTKKVTPPGGAETTRTTRKWLYDASLVFALTEDTTVFANTVRGVEESGTAPQNAVNRFAVLPPVIAREYELGIRQQLSDGLALTLSGFDTTKLTAGLDPNGVYALVGKVRHRGGEVSLTGRVAENTSVVIGALAMKPTLSGQLVDAGLVSTRPVGVSSSLAFAGIDQTFDWAPSWAFDARASWQAGRAADATNTFGAKGFMMGSVGARYNFAWGEQKAQIRLLTSNMFGHRPFVIGPSGLINIFGPTTWRATLRITF